MTAKKRDFLPAKTPGLYIHIPFCKRKCGYCSFYSETHLELAPLFLQTLPREMELYRGRFGIFDSIYLGGGTPSLTAAQDLESILKAVHTGFPVSPDSETTLEANPSDLSPDYLASLRSMGFNRLNIGIQSFHGAVLEFLGRRHTVDDALKAFDSARRAGFSNVGLDLIYGVPGQDAALWTDSLKAAVELEPEHLSCYELSLSPETALGRMHRLGRFVLPDVDSSYALFMETSEILDRAGYVHYEVSNFARGEAFVSRHNRKYWDHSPYLGLGPGAHSFSAGSRWWNHQSVREYSGDLEAGQTPVEGKEDLSCEEMALEALFLGLRTRDGVNLGDFRSSYGMDLQRVKGDAIRRFEEQGLVVIQDGFLRPTLRGMAVADSLSLI